MVRFNTEKFEIARHRASFSNKKVCEMVGITPGTLCTWKNGKNIPSSENLTKLADVLGINSSELLVVERDEKTQGEHQETGKNKLISSLLNAAAAVMDVKEELSHIERSEIDEKQITELLNDTEIFFAKIWKIIKLQINE